MSAVIRYLLARRELAFFIALTYYLLVVLTHEKVGKFVERTLDVPMGRERYNLLVVISALILLMAFLLWFTPRLVRMESNARWVIGGITVFTVSCIIVAMKTIVVINIELIHVFQYAIMAVLLYPLLPNYREVLFWASLLGAFDELYQYLVLAPQISDYYDFNDVIINMLGASMGMLILRIQGFENKWAYRKWYKSPATQMMIGISSLIILMWLTGLLSVYPAKESNNSVIFEFVKIPHEGFWRVVPKADPFHVIRPETGLIILCILFNIFKNIGRKFDE